MEIAKRKYEHPTIEDVKLEVFYADSGQGGTSPITTDPDDGSEEGETP